MKIIFSLLLTLIISHTAAHTAELYVRPSRPCVYEPQSFFVYGDYLYWTAKAEGLDFAITNFTETPPFEISDGTIESVPSSWNSGFSVGVGTNNFTKPFDIDAHWTRFHSQSDRTLTASPNPILFLNAPDNIFNASLGYVSADWRLKVDTFDLLIGRYVDFQRAFSFHPFIGATGGWINQEFDTFNFVNIVGNPITSISIDNTCNFRFVGIKAGFSTFWTFCKGFGVYGDLATSLVCGKYEIDYMAVISSTTIPANFDFSNDYVSSKAALQLGAGLSWGTDFSKWLHFGIRAGWETNTWFHLNQWNQLQGDFSFVETSNGNLTLQGLTVRARLDF